MAAMMDHIVDRYRQVEKELAKHAPARVFATIPRTGKFVGRTIARARGEEIEGLPVPSLSPSLLAHVALDEAMLLVAMGPNRFPRREDYERVGAELAEARALHEEQGWTADPASYHLTPQPLEHPHVSKGWAFRERYERLSWSSGFEPRQGEPGSERWMHFAPNHIAGAWVLRHDDGPRPWLVCVHGFGMGYPFMEFPAFQASKLHHELGLNLVGPMLPLHGRRKVTPMSGEAFLNFDMMNSVFGLAQSVWDIRRLLGWVQMQEPTSIGIYGVSLGAYVASLLVGLDDRLDAVIAGIPVSDFPALFHSHAPAHIRLRTYEHDILGGCAEEVHRVVSPLVLEPQVPLDRRFIYAALGDRMSHPRQAHDLWLHWDRPEIRWYPGNHMGFLWSGEVKTFVRESLRKADLAR